MNRWRYNGLGNLTHVVESDDYQRANPGFLHTFQLVNVEDFQGKGESTPSAYFYQNLGEAEYVVALFQYMVLIGYPPEKISILTKYFPRQTFNILISYLAINGRPSLSDHCFHAIFSHQAKIF